MEDKNKVDEIKEEASQKKVDIKKKAGEVKKGINEKKEDITKNIKEVKEGASEKKEEVKEKVSEVKGEAVKQKEQLEKESEEEGRNPAEKVLTDFINNFRQKTGEINEAYGVSESKTPEKPLVDVLETNEDIIIIADISGVKKEDIGINVSKTNVTITTNFKDELPIEDAKFLQKERSYGVHERTIDLSTPIRNKEATAKFKKCTLTIKLPKIEKDVITKIEIE